MIGAFVKGGAKTWRQLVRHFPEDCPLTTTASCFHDSIEVGLSGKRIRFCKLPTTLQLIANWLSIGQVQELFCLGRYLGNSA